MSKSARKPRRRRALRGVAVVLVLPLATACTFIGEPEVVAGSETTVTFRWTGGSPPHEAARAYCARHGRTTVYQGGIAVGQLGGGTMYAFDCIERPAQ